MFDPEPPNAKPAVWDPVPTKSDLAVFKLPLVDQALLKNCL